MHPCYEASGLGWFGWHTEHTANRRRRTRALWYQFRREVAARNRRA